MLALWACLPTAGAWATGHAVAPTHGEGVTPVISKTTDRMPAGDTIAVVSGVVRLAEDHTPVVGATVKFEGTAFGATTDIDGRFRLLNVPAGTMLEISYLGTQPLRVAAGAQMDVLLKADAIALDDVVITGYQEIDKRKLSSAITTMKASEFLMPAATSIDQMLQGRIAGMAVLNVTGTPGVAPKIRIRGSSSITGNRDPLWVVDGIILDDPVAIAPELLNNIDNVNFVGNAISGINPSDIERIDILKDVSATAIYGSKAANGVVVVTTKRGAKGKPRINYTGNVSVTERPHYSNLYLMNSKERIEMSEEMLERGLEFRTYQPTSMGYEGELEKLWRKDIDYDTFRQNVAGLKTLNTDWMKLLFRNAVTTQHALSISGAGENADYYLSLGYTNQQGASRYEGLRRITAMLKANMNITERLHAGLKISTSDQQANYPHSSVPVLDYAYRISRAIPLYNPDGSLFYYDNDKTEFGTLPFNIINELETTGKDVSNRGTVINLTLDWRPWDWLKISGLGGINLNNSKQNQWADEQSFYISRMRMTPFGVRADNQENFMQKTELPIGGTLNTETNATTRYSWRTSIDFNKTFGRHAIFATAGNELSSVVYDGVQSLRLGYMPFRGKTFANIELSSYPEYTKLIQSSADKITDNSINTLSLYSSVTYSYLNRYIANFNIRTDGSNRFGQDKNARFLPVWSVSGRWNAADEPFIRNLKWIDMLAIRASYGVQGNVHPAQTPFLIVRQENYNSTVQDFVSTLKQFPNRSLRWEKTVSYNIGLDFGFLNNRLSGTLDLYKKMGYDQIVDLSIVPSNGATSVVLNEGDIENRGWELSVNVVPVLTKDWVWSLSVSTGKNYNKVIKEGDTQATWKNYLNGTLIKNGTAVNSFYAYRFKGLDHETGLPTFYGLNELDENGKRIINSQQEAFDAAFVYAGKQEPDLTGGFSSSLKYKQFTLNALFSFSVGSSLRLNPLYLNSGQALPFPQQNMSQEYVNRWKQPGDEAFTNIPVLYDENLQLPPYDYKYPVGENLWEMYNMSDIRVVSGSFLRCRSINLRYDLPGNLLRSIGVKGGSIAFEADNVFVLKDKKLKGRDPEQLSLSSGTIPPQRAYSLQVSLNF